jgi:hypothetical protein
VPPWVPCSAMDMCQQLQKRSNNYLHPMDRLIVLPHWTRRLRCMLGWRRLDGFSQASPPGCCSTGGCCVVWASIKRPTLPANHVDALVQHCTPLPGGQAFSWRFSDSSRAGGHTSGYSAAGRALFRCCSDAAQMWSRCGSGTVRMLFSCFSDVVSVGGIAGCPCRWPSRWPLSDRLVGGTAASSL